MALLLEAAISKDFKRRLNKSESHTPVAFRPDAVAQITRFGNSLQLPCSLVAIGKRRILCFLGLRVAVVLSGHTGVRQPLCNV